MSGTTGATETEVPTQKTYLDNEELRIEAKRTEFDAAPFLAEVTVTDKHGSRRVKLARLATPYGGTSFTVKIMRNERDQCELCVDRYESDEAHVEGGHDILYVLDRVGYLRRVLSAALPNFPEDDYFGLNVRQGLEISGMIRDEALELAGKKYTKHTMAALRQI